MIQTIKETSHYKLSIDKENNWIIVKAIGFWRSPEVVPNYLSEINEIITMRLRPKFMAVIDASDMLTHPKSVQEGVHLVGMQNLKKHKPATLVVVMPQDEISVMQAKHLGKVSQTEFLSFKSMAEAERYLEEFAKEHGLFPYQN